MSPRFADVGGFSLWLYFSEPHQRPHVAIRSGRRRVATMDITTGELLAGRLRSHDLRRLQAFIKEHREALLAAFDAATRHSWPGTMRVAKEDGDEQE